MNTQQPAGCCTIGWRPEGREIKERGDTSWSRFRRFCKATSISERKSEGLSVCVCDQAKSLAVRETAWHQGWIIHPRLHPLKYWCPDNPLHISASHTVPSFFTFSHLQSFISTGNSFSSQTRTGKNKEMEMNMDRWEQENWIREMLHLSIYCSFTHMHLFFRSSWTAGTDPLKQTWERETP